MAGDKSDGAGSFFASPNVLLALLTVAGGVWLVSQKLTSDRPVSPAAAGRVFIGDQRLESRLWEDPFKSSGLSESKDPENESPAAIDVATLVAQIQLRQQRGSAKNTKPLLLLPVMVSGGHYSEDTESRIRSRYAIVSALGQAGYAPEDAEHIGAIRVPWLTQQQLASAKRTAAEKPDDVSRLWTEAISPGETTHLGRKLTAHAPAMEARYEWYRRRVFSEGSGTDDLRSNVLVLWLDESYFEDDPLLRLSLLVERLLDADPVPDKPPLEIALIGPRRSSTLRSMLPDWETGHAPYSDSMLSHIMSRVLPRIDLFCATPSAMDETLVKDPVEPDQAPRRSVRDALTKPGLFRSFHNFAATDAQMAEQILDELSLRGADLRRPGNHVVLISEWDTFYARMLALTYRAQLASLQQMQKREPGPHTRADFVRSYLDHKEAKRLPPNFHSLVYLRGLDGQTVGGTGSDPESNRPGQEGKSAPESIEEFRRWAPDVNKAEGQAQFDYLGRMGEQVQSLRVSLRRENKGDIKAVGIVGSDVYDTLLILQALRQQFPDLLFFTTDLDVRFLHPHERKWARNLIVASAYGLQLHPDLQGTVSPFRDSTQTAQFTAALAALGNRDLAGIVRIPPRRFEIGNNAVIDLSVEDCRVATSHPRSFSSPPFLLHPVTRCEASRGQIAQRVLAGGFVALAIAFGASWIWPPMRRLTWDALKFPCQALEYTEEDVGGADGVAGLLRGLDESPDDPIARWLLGQASVSELRRKTLSLREDSTELTGKLDASSTAIPLERKKLEDQRLKADWDRAQAQTELATEVVAYLNQFLRQEKLADMPSPLPGISPDLGAVASWFVARLRHWPRIRTAVERYEARLALDAYLARIACQPAAGGSEPPMARPVPVVASPRAESRRSSHSGWREIGRFCDMVIGAKSPRRADELTERTNSQTQLSAAAAREAGQGVFCLRCRQLICFWIGFAGFGGAAVCMAWAIWGDTFTRATGEPFSLTSGTSSWPTEILRLLVFTLAICFGVGLSHTLREAFLKLTRRFRLFRPRRRHDRAGTPECAQSLWYEYCDGSRFRQRCRTLWVIPVYILLLFAVRYALGDPISKPLRGEWISHFHTVLAWGSILGFLVLAVLTVDAAWLCRGFIEKLSARPTKYPESTRRYFSRQKGEINEEYLDEWIDLQLIADLTEQVGRLVYYPAGLVVLLLLARNSWWDRWTWPVSLIVIFACNFLLALASVVILQRAARNAKREAEKSLTAKVKHLQAQAAPSVEQNNASQAEKLLEEIRELNRGAFVPFWENPVVGAVFLSSGGTTMLQILFWFMGR